ncbi:uncharacterized protein VTP21DRAFT_10645 [Calcarisporiella thermophila]|uniref:uncharacterized protein n=1 Tax=Calcarisporiella thermophila TaxID=911321 RepID=UPI0037448EA3
MAEMKVARVTGNAFALGTLALDTAGWVILFSGAIAIRDFGILWWMAIYELVLLIGISYVFLTEQLWNYRVMIVGLLVYSITILSQLASVLLGVTLVSTPGGTVSPFAPAQAGAAGCILILIAQFSWIVYFGREGNSFSGQNVNGKTSRAQESEKIAAPPRAVVMGANTDIVDAGGATTSSINSLGLTPGSRGRVRPLSTLQQNVEYNYKAKALYKYNANPEDPNEISFEKDEIMAIASTNGRWWQARKLDGTVGIVPSNYLRLI